MAADEIVVVLVVGIFVGFVALISIHSRRQATDAPPHSAHGDDPQPAADDGKSISTMTNQEPGVRKTP
jgi:hypothetical protein